MYTHQSKEMYESLAEVFGSENNVVAKKQKSFAAFAATIVDLLGKNNVPALTLFDDQGHALVFCVAGLPDMYWRARQAFEPWLKGGSGTGDVPVVLRLDVGFFSRMKRSADDAMKHWCMETHQLLTHFGIDFSGPNDELLAFIDAIPEDADGTVRAMLGNPPVPVFLLDFICNESCSRTDEKVARLITLRVL